MTTASKALPRPLPRFRRKETGLRGSARTGPMVCCCQGRGLLVSDAGGSYLGEGRAAAGFVMRLGLNRGTRGHRILLAAHLIILWLSTGTGAQATPLSGQWRSGRPGRRGTQSRCLWSVRPLPRLPFTLSSLGFRMVRYGTPSSSRWPTV